MASLEDKTVIEETLHTSEDYKGTIGPEQIHIHVSGGFHGGCDNTCTSNVPGSSIHDLSRRTYEIAKETNTCTSPAKNVKTSHPLPLISPSPGFGSSSLLRRLLSTNATPPMTNHENTEIHDHRITEANNHEITKTKNQQPVTQPHREREMVMKETPELDVSLDITHKTSNASIQKIRKEHDVVMEGTSDLQDGDPERDRATKCYIGGQRVYLQGSGNVCLASDDKLVGGAKWGHRLLRKSDANRKLVQKADVKGNVCRNSFV